MALRKLNGEQRLEMLRDRIFNLEEFTAICNRWLWEYIPENYQGTRAKEPISSRNIRHYASENLLDEPLKAGKEARYAYRHLIQVLLIRRASAEGYTSKLMYSILQQDTAQLERLLAGELPSLEKPERISQSRNQVAWQQKAVRLEDSVLPAPAPKQALAANNTAQSEALEYLASLSTPRRRLETPSPKQPHHIWQQYELEAGIELWLRHDAQKPRTELERQRLLETIETILKN